MMKFFLCITLIFFSNVYGIDKYRLETDLKVCWELYESQDQEKAILICSSRIEDPLIDDIERVHYLVARSVFFCGMDNMAYQRDIQYLNKLASENIECWRAWREYD